MSEELGLVERYITQFTEDLSRREPLNAILMDVLGASGKRLRPRMVLACGLTGKDFGTKKDRLCRMAALIEMVHGASLIHDDIIDDSPLRRGKETIQAKYGKDMAVYTGDYILGKVLFHLMEMRAADSGMILGACVQEMCAGELNQYCHKFDSHVSEEEYFAAIHGKTAALFGAACQIGALEGGCGSKEQENARRLGEVTGIFFQLRDDLMDFQTEKKWDGKPTCQDFFQGIYTLPVIHALGHPDTGSKMRKLIEQSQHQDVREDELRKQLDSLILEADGISYAKKCMETYKNKVFEALRRMPEGDGKKEIERLIKVLADLG